MGNSFPIDRPGYTTIQTRLNCLVDKGQVQRSDGRPAHYSATVPRKQIRAEHLDELVQRLSGGNVVPLVAHLVEDRKIDADQLAELKQLVIDAEQESKSAKRIKKNQTPRIGRQETTIPFLDIASPSLAAPTHLPPLLNDSLSRFTNASIMLLGCGLIGMFVMRWLRPEPLRFRSALAVIILVQGILLIRLPVDLPILPTSQNDVPTATQSVALSQYDLPTERPSRSSSVNIEQPTTQTPGFTQTRPTDTSAAQSTSNQHAGLALSIIEHPS
ncbi:MAG: BlaI/MecI/CopY family transcriptional regulator, partial [Planctomycetota bacterium]